MKPYKIYAENVEIDAMNQFYEAMKQDCTISGALMPDAHKGYTLPIGSVIETKGRVFPAYVGYDIGCGMCAIETDFDVEEIKENAQKIYHQIMRDVPVGFNKHNKTVKEHAHIKIGGASEAMQEIFYNKNGFKQLGTLGGGNHFIEIGVGKGDKVWIIIHSGSRGVGHGCAEHYMKLAAMDCVDRSRYEDEFEEKNKDFKLHNFDKFEKAKEEFVYRRTRARLKTNLEGHYGFGVDTVHGKEYIQDMNWCLDFALLNRKAMIRLVIEAINHAGVDGEGDYDGLINRNHNHAESKDGVNWIHRKGATHAEEGMMGVIPGNMLDGSFIVRGKGDPDSLYSSSHGAGRVLSRSKAKKEVDVNDFVDVMDGIVANVGQGTLDESPFAYKDIYEVMRLQADLVDIIDHVKPIINVKG